MKYLRWLLFPFSLLYGLIVIIRNWCYDAGILKSTQFGIPVISVGNLQVGGAGKSPMTEYLVRLLKDQYKLATLSRGYGRETKGYLIATENIDANQIGDEPAQFKHKFPNITVAVCEDRVAGITRLQDSHQLIILDDAYQHRAVKSGFSILLFDHSKVNEPHLLLPAGDMREPFTGRWRADVLVVSKCPPDLSANAQAAIIEQLRPLPWQSVFFTAINYQPLQNMAGKPTDLFLDADTTVLLLTGIANPAPLLQHIRMLGANVIHHNYPDHHRFSLKNITKLADEFDACTAQKKVIITTEKDAQRLVGHETLRELGKRPVFVIPIGVAFLNHDQQQFDQLVTTHVREYTANYSIH